MSKWLKYIWGGVTLTTPIWSAPLGGFISHHQTIAAAIGAAVAFLSHVLADAGNTANASH